MRGAKKCIGVKIINERKNVNKKKRKKKKVRKKTQKTQKNTKKIIKNNKKYLMGSFSFDPGFLIIINFVINFREVYIINKHRVY